VLEEHPLAIDVPSEEDVVVASPTLIETGPEHLPRLGEASTTAGKGWCESHQSCGCLGSDAQPPALTLERPTVSPLFGFL